MMQQTVLNLHVACDSRTYSVSACARVCVVLGGCVWKLCDRPVPADQ